MYNPKDHNQQLADYIKRNLSKGYPIEALRQALVNQGYSKISITNAINLANRQIADNVPVMKEKPQITYKLLDESNEPIETIRVSEPERKGFWKKLFSK